MTDIRGNIELQSTIHSTHCSNSNLNLTTSNENLFSQHSNLTEANPDLLSKPQYLCQQLVNRDESFNLSDDDDDLYLDNDTNDIRITDTNYLNSDDDIIIDNDDDDHFHPECDIHHIAPNPISNIFLHHPHFNDRNDEFQRAMKTFTCLSQTSDQTPPLQIPINTISVPILDPQDINKTVTITAAADNGSDIQAIGLTAILRYREQNLIRHDPKGITIATGNGPVHIHNYVPITVKSKIGKMFTTKFWCLESLPTYDFLIGRHLLHKLGWQLVNKYDLWEHKPHNIDHVDTELDELLCTRYPFKGEPELDIRNVKIDNPELSTFIKAQLVEYKDVIARHEWDSGKLKGIPDFEINFIENEHPYKQGFMSKEYWTNPTQRNEVRRQLRGMMDYDKIEICNNPLYISSIFCVSKKTGDIRIVFDYRKLNEITEKYLYPIPDTTKLLNKFKGKRYITSLDLKGGYWHIPIKPEHRHKTGFIFDGQIYQWKVMPFGPTNAPMYFQRCMEAIFRDLDFVTIYLDDISILSDTLEEHKAHLKIVFNLLKKHQIKLRLDKCLWGVSESEYLGFIVDRLGVKCKASYVKKIMDVPIPAKKTGLKRFLGLVQFLHQFIPQMHHQISILTPLTSANKPDKIQWNATQIDAFNKVKEMVQSTKPLAHPDMKQPFHVFTDASKNGIGGMLAQVKDGHMQPIAYCSKVFTETQTRWHVSEQEIYAAIYCVEKWSDLLRHRKFTLHTDHKNLQKLFNKAANFKSGKLFRWAVRLQDYHFECQYVKGTDNIVADYLSRESVLVQMSPQYASIKEFYDANTAHNPIRRAHSNSGGVDIVKLYVNHLLITILNRRTHLHYFHNADPYQILDPSHQSPKPTYSGDILSSQSHQFLNISTLDQYNIIHNYYQPTLTQSNIHQHNIQHNIQQSNVKCYPLGNKNNTNNNDDISSISSMDSDIEMILRNIPSPPPYIQPTDQTNAHERNRAGNSKTKAQPRRSKRLIKKSAPKPRHQPLFIQSSAPKTSKQLRKNGAYAKRESRRKSFKHINQTIINSKPYEHVWNANLLMARYYIPIQDDYGHLFDQTQHIQSNLMRFKQWEDPICFAIINFLDSGNKSLITDLPKYIRRYILSGRFKLDQRKILCFRHTRSKIPLQVVPASLLASLLKKVHTKFHHGSTKMIQIITNNMKYWWPKMRQHINIYCRCCATCQHQKPGVAKAFSKGGMKLFPATKPFDQISVDIVGPLPTSHSGNRYIVTMIDKFSRYCILNPVQDITALSVVKSIDRWITTFGPPKSILSDNGPQFISSIYRDYMDNHKGIKYKYTTTYHPQCNGQIERLHRWLKERLSLISYDGGLNFVTGEDDWSDYLPIIQYTYNSTPNRMTTYAPLDIVIGRNDYKLAEYKFDPNQPKAYIDYLVNRQTIIRRNANERQRIYDELRQKSYNKDKTDKEYGIGDKVLWNINTQFTGNKRKLGPKWIGPYEIIDIFNDKQNYKLRVIPLPPLEANNPMNKHKVPKRGTSHGRNNHPITEFTVPRDQIKPYYPSYESQFDGTESPLQILVAHLIPSNHQYDPTQKYHALFHICDMQMRMGYRQY